MLKLIEFNKCNKQELIKELKERKDKENEEIICSVKRIIKKVKEEKDSAVHEFTKAFDKVNLEKFEVTKDELNECFQNVDKNFIDALLEAKSNIEKYHIKQKSNGYMITSEDKVLLGQRVIPLEKVAVYVPGGTASYPSSVLMNVIPAKVAGVKEIIMITPPAKNGKVNPYIGVAASIAGVDKIFKVGGAQGIAAVAYGTETIPMVDKIVGPGNIYVATAKKLVFGQVDIDMIAGPSEILVIADENSNPEYIAADLMSQAEHDKLSSSILITTSKKIYEEVEGEIEKQIKNMERKQIIESSFKSYGKAIICGNIEECFEISNVMAPEHLEIMLDDAIKYIGLIKNAGSVFLGKYCPEPVGDYFAGTNHVLPTNGSARFFSPLSVDSFIKKSSFIYYSEEAIKKNADKIITLAERESLTAHANSIKVRVK